LDDTRKIYHVGIALRLVVSAVIIGFLNASDNSRKNGIIIGCFIETFGIIVKTYNNIINFGKVNNRKCSTGFRIYLRTGFIKAVAYDLSKLCTVGSRILTEKISYGGVVPAVPGFYFLRGVHIS